ncbi:N4-gp56 family major capsid protein [Candidatus Kaiserbacteria bacterium]|nr:N4-gp56 family major capsid protein [Candidatus Kaiserbacteria bacterium]
MSSTTTGLAEHMSIYYDKRFLERAKLMLKYDIGAVVKPLPQNSGKTVYFNRMTPLAVATTPLTEATNPSAVDMTSTIVSATVAEYGNYTKVGSLYETTTIDVGLREHVDVHAQNAGETIDTLIRDELDGGGTAQIVNGLALTAVTATDIIDGYEVRKAALTLKKNKALPFENGYFRAIVPVSVAQDLRGDSEWLDAYRYTDASNIRDGQIGRLHGVEFYETNNEVVSADAGSGNVDVYSTFVFGANAYGMVDIGSDSEPKIIYKRPGASDTSNPLDMFSTIGWKATFVAKVLNANWLIELKTASSFGAN